MIGRFASVAAFIRSERPDVPVHLLRPRQVRAAARSFVEGFPGDVLYAVKCNAHPLVLETLHGQGIRHFDVASPMEIRRVAETLPGATAFYHHPAKSPAQIELARDYGIRHFAVDCIAELDKVAGLVPDAIPMVRLAIPPGNGAVYDLSTKFGAPPDRFRAVLEHAHALGLSAGITFHVGSQCLDPQAFRSAIRLATSLLDETGLPVRLMDIGGGFPAYYRLTEAPPLAAYFAAIAEAGREWAAPRGIRLMCEPGRAMAAEGGSLLTRIVLTKAEAIHINDGIFGGLTEVYWGKEALSLPYRVVDEDGRPRRGRARPVAVYGPTCDGNDRLPYPLAVPEDAGDGDYIEFNLIGAYGREMAARYNGMVSDAMATIDSDFDDE